MLKRKKGMIRVCAVALIAAMLLSFAVGCEKKGKDEGEVTELNWYINMQQWTASPELWETASALKEALAKTGVKLNITVPTGSGAEKINLMLATGDMPDMITCVTEDTQIDQLIKANAIYPLDELMDKYAPDMKKEIPEEVRIFGAQPLDGVLYGIPSYVRTDWQMETKDRLNTTAFVVRSDIYEELGSPDMTTPEGFYNALVAFKEKYPEMDGKKTIPLSLWCKNWSLDTFKRTFGIKSFYLDDNGNYYQNWMDPKNEDFIRYMAKLNAAGLTDPETYVKKQDQVLEDMSAGRVFAAVWQFDALYDVNKALGASFPGARYKVIEPMSATGERTTMKDFINRGWTTTFIPREAKNPEAALKFMRYMFSYEGWIQTNLGEEGKDWVEVDELNIKRTPEMQEAMKDDNFEKEVGLGSYGLFWRQYKNILPADGVEQNIMDIEDRPLANELVDLRYVYRSLMKPLDPESDESMIKTRADNIISKAAPKIYMESNADAALAAYKKMIDDVYSLGYDKVDAYNTEQHKIAKKRYEEIIKK